MRKSIIALTVVSVFASVAANASDFSDALSNGNSYQIIQIANNSNHPDNAQAQAWVDANYATIEQKTPVAPAQITPPKMVNQIAPQIPVSTQKTPVLVIEPTQKTPVAIPQKAPVKMNVPPVIAAPQIAPVRQLTPVEQKTPVAIPSQIPQLVPVSTQKTPVAGKIPPIQQQQIPVISVNNQKTPVAQKVPTVQQQSIPVIAVNNQKTPVQQLIPTVKPVEQKTPVAHTQLTPAKNGVNGVNGSNGVNGKDGVTTVKTVNVVDNAAHEQINANKSRIETNSADIVSNHNGVIANSNAIHHNSAAIERNSQRINKNASDIAENRKAIKRVGAMAQAASNLHYNRNENGYAVSVGEYSQQTAIAGGVQFKTGESTAITVQVSYDGASVGGSVGFHGDF